MQTAGHIISQMRVLSGLNTAKYPDAQAIIDLNIVKDEFWNEFLTENQEDGFGANEWLINLVSNTGIYDIPEIAYNKDGTKKVTNVLVNYSGDTYSTTGLSKYIEASQVNIATLGNDWNYYCENQSKENPIYFLKGNSIYLAPYPKQGVTSGIKVKGIRKLKDWTTSTTEADMIIPVDAQQALIYGLVVLGYMYAGKDENTIIPAENRWERKKNRAINTMLNRNQDAFLNNYPD